MRIIFQLLNIIFWLCVLIIAIALLNFKSPPVIPVLIVACSLVWYWKKHKDSDNTANRKEEQIEEQTLTIDGSIEKPLEHEQPSPPESERLTARQAAALLAASNNFYIYNGQANRQNKNRYNTFNTRTLSSLSSQNLLVDDGNNSYYLTFMGYRMLRQLQFMPGMEWRPPFFGSINIKYRDENDVITERIVDIYDWNRHTIYAYCHLRNRNRHTFSIKNIITAIDINTGEHINDMLAWLKIHGLRKAPINK